ncbi:MAG: hypothetical protein LAQ30_07550 [Acidobacteriia bacterium]|nr:hypothetical protein [Terriglobia bacterium]
MKRKLLRTALLLSAAGLLVAQRPAQSPVLMADDGSIIPAHRTIHRKNGETVNWSRRTTGQRSWYVKFAQSPCKEGDVFGSENGRTTCTVAVACRNTGDPACKSYKYSSALSSQSTLHDPDVIVDP